MFLYCSRPSTSVLRLKCNFWRSAAANNSSVKGYHIPNGNNAYVRENKVVLRDDIPRGHWGKVFIFDCMQIRSKILKKF